MKRKVISSLIILTALIVSGSVFSEKWITTKPSPTWGIVLERVYHPKENIIYVDEAALFKPSKKKPKTTYASRIQEEGYILVVVDSTLTEWNLETTRKQFFAIALGDTISLKGTL